MHLLKSAQTPVFLFGLLMSAVLSSGSAEAVLQGDATLNGVVDLADGLLIQRHVDSEIVLSGDAFSAADLAPLVSGVSEPDGAVDSTDFEAFLRMLQLPAPVLQLPAPPVLTNPIYASGSATPNTTVTIFVGGVAQASVTSAGDGSFTNLPVILDDGDNLVQVAESAGGLTGFASSPQTVNYVNSVDPDAPIVGLTAWTASGPDGGYYDISSDLVIPSGATLVLLPEAKLRFKSGLKLIVQAGGELRIEGQVDKLVRLLPKDPAYWRGIQVLSGGTATLEYARIQWVSNGIEVFSGGALTLADSSVESFDFKAIVVRAGGTADIQRCEIHNDDGSSYIPVYPRYGVYIEGPSDVLVADCRMRKIARTGIFIESGATAVISGNEIGPDPANPDPVRMFYAIETFADAEIVNNHLFGVSRGLTIGGGSPNVLQNLIAENNTAIRLKGGSPHVAENTLGNLSGVGGTTIWVDGGVGAGQILDFENNYWVTTSPTTVTTNTGQIVAMLHDFNRNSNLATVDFSPFLDAAGTPTGANVLYGELVADVTLPAGTYQLQSLYVISPGVTLTLLAGVTIELWGGKVESNGTLRILGLPGDPVIIRSSRNPPEAGNWAGIRLGASSTGNLIEHLQIEHATDAIYVEVPQSGAPLASNAVIRDSEISDFLTSGITVAAGGHAEIENVEIRDSSTGAGIRVEAATASVSGSEFHDLAVGGSVGEDGALVISDSSLYDNVLNVVVDPHSPVTAPVFDFQQNYWGVTTALEIAQTIDDGPGVVVFSSFLDAVGGTIVPGSDFLFTKGVVDVGRDKESIVPAQPGGDLLPIHATILALSDVELWIYEDQSVEAGFGGETLIGKKSVGQWPAGVADIDWDGRGGPDLDGDVVTDGAYYYEIHTAVVGGPTYSYSPTPPVQSTAYNSGSFADNDYNIYQNDLLHLAYTITTSVNQEDWVSRLKMWVGRGDDLPAGGGALPASFPTGYQLVQNPPSFAGNFDLYWDGRDPMGVPMPALDPLTDRTYVYVSVPEPLGENAFLVSGGLPSVAGPAEVAVRSDPYLIHHSYEQVTQIEYCHDLTADVTIQILKPGLVTPVPGGDYNDGVVATFTQPLASPAGCYTVQWTGYDPSQITFNDALPDAGSGTGGIYTFTIEAANSAHPSVKSLYRGVIQVRQ